MSHFTIFLHGNIQFAQVQQIVLGRELQMVKAILPNHTEGKLQGLGYPVVIEDQQQSVQGYIAPVDASELSTLREFNNSGPVAGAFEMQEKIVVGTQGQIMSAKVFVFNTQSEHKVEAEQFDVQKYKETILPSYIERLQQIYGGNKNDI